LNGFEEEAPSYILQTIMASPSIGFPVAYSEALKTLQDDVDFAKSQAIVWGSVYYVTRILLIVLAGWAAYEAKFVANGVHNTAAILSAIVSIGTGIETALKPSAKHKTHFVYNDLYTSLRLRALAIDPNDAAAVQTLITEISQLDAKYQQEQF
jgi:hypothetical protein